MIELRATTVTAPSPCGPETWVFGSDAEAQAKAAFVREALSWVGTPFRDCADVKGKDGAVDCAMLLVRSGVEAGLRPAFDPRPYSPRHMLHSFEEQFLGWVKDKLGGREVDAPRFGDIVIWRFGRVFSHGGILINSEEVVHAYAHARMCIVSRLDEHPLKYVGHGSHEILRPVKYFDVWDQGSGIGNQVSEERCDDHFERLSDS